MNFTATTNVKGTQGTIETSIGIIKVGSKVVISTKQGNREQTVTEMNNRWIKTDYQFSKFDNKHLGLVEMGVYATVKIIAVV